MAKPEWGTKRVCLSCGARFYDMLRDPIVCPSCETVFDPTATIKTKRTRAAPKAVAEKVVVAKAVEEDEEEDEVEAAEVDDDAAEDDDGQRRRQLVVGQDQDPGTIGGQQ